MVFPLESTLFGTLLHLQVRSLSLSPPCHPPLPFQLFPLLQHALCSVLHVIYSIQKL